MLVVNTLRRLFQSDLISRQGWIPFDLYWLYRLWVCTIWPSPGVSHGAVKGKVNIPSMHRISKAGVTRQHQIWHPKISFDTLVCDPISRWNVNNLLTQLCLMPAPPPFGKAGKAGNNRPLCLVNKGISVFGWCQLKPMVQKFRFFFVTLWFQYPFFENNHLWGQFLTMQIK